MFLDRKIFLLELCFSGGLMIRAAATVATAVTGGSSEELSDFSVRDLKNFLTLGAPLFCSAFVRTEVKEVAPHLPTMPADLAATGLLHCSFIIRSKGLPDLPPGPFRE